MAVGSTSNFLLQYSQDHDKFCRILTTSRIFLSPFAAVTVATTTPSLLTLGMLCD